MRRKRAHQRRSRHATGDRVGAAGVGLDSPRYNGPRLALLGLIISVLAGCGVDSAPTFTTVIDAGAGTLDGCVATGCSADVIAGSDAGRDGGADALADGGGAESDAVTAGDTAGTGADGAGTGGAGTGGDGASSDGQTADAGPQDVFALKPGLPVQAIITQLSPGPWQFAAPVQGDVALAIDKKGAVNLIGPLKGQVDPIQGVAQAATAVVRFAGMTYLADANGLRGILAAKLKPSPLAKYLPTKPITVLNAHKTSGGVDLWMIVGDKLLLYRLGKLFTITVPAMNVSGAQLSFGADVAGSPAVWVGGKSGLHALRVSNGKVTSWSYLAGRVVDGVHVDTKGRVWAVSQGELLRRDAPGAWSTHVPTDPLTALWGRPGDAVFWVRTKSALLRWEAAELHPVKGAPAVAAWQLDGAGRLIGLDSKGALLRVQTTPPPAKPKVAWTTDIVPLFEKSCAQCHGVDGVYTKLHTRLQWKARIKAILKNVTSGAMPLPPKSPLTSGEIALIKAWETDGFKETP